MSTIQNVNLSTGLVGPCSLFDKSKGSVGNRIKCAGAHTVNEVKTAAKVAGAAGALGLATVA